MISKKFVLLHSILLLCFFSFAAQNIDKIINPAEVERTAALFIAFPDAVGRSQGDRTAPDTRPLPSEPEALAAALREFAAEGVGHVQLVLDPISAQSIARLEPMLALLDA